MLGTPTPKTEQLILSVYEDVGLKIDEPGWKRLLDYKQKWLPGYSLSQYTDAEGYAWQPLWLILAVFGPPHTDNAICSVRIKIKNLTPIVDR